jgi:hypothetical protein
MIDSDNVLLLKPARPGAITPRTGLHVATTWPLAAAADAELLAFIDKTVMPLWRDAGADWLATLVTEPHPNTFPRLPVREGEKRDRHLGTIRRRHGARALPKPRWRSRRRG